jgi:hypothetical protein
MEKPRFWILTAVGILLTPIFFLASTYAGSGPDTHAGAGFQILAFFPIPTIIGVEIGSWYISIVLAAIQFPLFGFILSYIREYTQSFLLSLLSAFIWLHIGISVLVLALMLVSAAAGR